MRIGDGIAHHRKEAADNVISPNIECEHTAQAQSIARTPPAAARAPAKEAASDLAPLLLLLEEPTADALPEGAPDPVGDAPAPEGSVGVADAGG